MILNKQIKTIRGKNDRNAVTSYVVNVKTGTATERFNTFQQAMTSLAETYTANSSALDLYGYKFFEAKWG